MTLRKYLEKVCLQYAENRVGLTPYKVRSLHYNKHDWNINSPDFFFIIIFSLNIFMKFDKYHDYRSFILAEEFSSDSNIIIFSIIYYKELRDEILHEDPSITTEVAEVCSWVKLGLTFLIVSTVQL